MVTLEMTLLQEKISKISIELHSRHKRYMRLSTLCKSEIHTCCVCLDKFNREDMIFLDCCQNALLCTECLEGIIKTSKKCPLCRHLMDTSTLWVKKISTNNNNIETNYNSKMGALESILTNPLDKKFLIFAWSDVSCKTVKYEIELFDDIYPRIIYPSEIRSKSTIGKFYDGDINVLLEGAREVSSGLHLPSITDVIIFQEMDTTIVNQCITRAHRYPRNVSLRVHFILYESERLSFDIDSITDKINGPNSNSEISTMGENIDKIAYNSNYFQLLQHSNL